MSYQVLARKWRPQNFQELVGQEHVLKPLINALTQQRLHHAYLFTGTRGVGKTTIARILARCLNCETGITNNPCGQCSACKDITLGRFVDLIEVDAASRTRVEDTRELLDNVQYAPTRGRFKIYLIDEVHMLSNHSFNALLKTLEEPPPHVKFLLATTDPQRLPITILSRCLQFHLKNLAPEIISQHLQTIINNEQIEAEPAALFTLAQAANGSVRDSLSLLDQAIAYCQGKITIAQIQSMLGTVDKQFLDSLLTGLAARDGQFILTTIQQMVELNIDFNQALEALLDFIHQLAVYQIVPEAAYTFNEGVPNYATHFSAEDIQLFYQIGLIGRRDLPLAPSPRIGFEMILLRMLAFYPDTARVPFSLEQQKITHSTLPSTPQVQTKSLSITQITNKNDEHQNTNNSPSAALVSSLLRQINVNDLQSSSETNWAEFIPKLNLTGVTAILASHCVVLNWQPDILELALAPKHKPLLNDKIQQRLNEALQNYYQRPIKLVIKLQESAQPSPAQQVQQYQEERQRQAKTNIEQDENIQTIISNFNAKLIRTDPV